MGHTGVTQFVWIGDLTQAHHGKIIPHATIGTGTFAAASLHASVTVLNLPYHEFQHSIFPHSAKMMSGRLESAEASFLLVGRLPFTSKSNCRTKNPEQPLPRVGVVGSGVRSREMTASIVR
ncbi:MAG: enolase [Sphingomonadales bacterium]|nr:enolase [Sphingomonadales bacterium]